MLNNWTHERIPRHAACLQWDGRNTKEIMAFLARHEMFGELWNEIFITVRKYVHLVYTLQHGTWLVEGEDKALRFYTDAKHKSMYQPIVKDDELERLREFARNVLGYGMVGLDENGIDELANKHGLLAQSLKAEG